jgi:hypothetical protein
MAVRDLPTKVSCQLTFLHIFMQFLYTITNHHLHKKLKYRKDQKLFSRHQVMVNYKSDLKLTPTHPHIHTHTHIYIYVYIGPLQSTRVIQKVKIKHGWEGKGNHLRPSRSQPRPRSQRFPFIFAFKETSGQPEVSRRRRGEIRRHSVVACSGGGVL